MGLNEIFGKTNPIIALSILHVIPKEIGQKEFQKELLEYHRSMKTESEKMGMLYNGHVEEFSAKIAQSLKGNLSEFLSMPLRSDSNEIQRILTDHIKQIRTQLLSQFPLGIQSIAEFKFSPDDHPDSDLKPFIQAGVQRVKKLMLQKQKLTYNELYELRIILEGNENIPFLENLVGVSFQTQFNKLFYASSTPEVYYYNLNYSTSLTTHSIVKYVCELTISYDLKSRVARPEIHQVIGKMLHEREELISSFWSNRSLLSPKTEDIMRIGVKDKQDLRHIYQFILDVTKELIKKVSKKSISIIEKEKLPGY